MIRRTVLGLAALALLAVPWASAQAGGGVRIGIGIGAPFWYRPYYPRVYVVPAPVYYAPAPVYVQPVPVVQPVYTVPAAPAPLLQTAPSPSPALPSQPQPVRN
ncbi:MAG TPA: hypothetical protein VGZ25_08380 [Gemmataceae bacterium]|jgi:hypothetical protein|nr:hypothetical protein [Gemmataceae bacterium]